MLGCSSLVKSPPRTDLFTSYPLTPAATSAALVVAPTQVTIDRNPAAVYLAGLSLGSRRTMRSALRVMAQMIEPTKYTSHGRFAPQSSGSVMLIA